MIETSTNTSNNFSPQSITNAINNTAITDTIRQPNNTLDRDPASDGAFDSNVIFARIFTQLKDAFLSVDGPNVNVEEPQAPSSATNKTIEKSSTPSGDQLANIIPGDSSLSDSQNKLLNAFQQSLFTSAEIETENKPTDNKDTTTAITPAKQGSLESALFGTDGLELNDVFDSFNVLNHIPFVSDLYQSVTASDVSTTSSMVGSYMMFGPASIVYNSINMITESVTGKSLAQNIVDSSSQLFFSDEPLSVTKSIEDNSIATPPAAGDTATSEAFPFADDSFLELSHDTYR